MVPTLSSFAGSFAQLCVACDRDRFFRRAWSLASLKMYVSVLSEIFLTEMSQIKTNIVVTYLRMRAPCNCTDDL